MKLRKALMRDPDDPWRATIIHESTHAAFELAGEKPSVEVDEACAYLAETVWWRTLYGRPKVGGDPQAHGH
ncbi:MAG TPA: hypothetical protein VD970_18170 [Acetobacteraceae bacterium]|nr:hypothetical protein [Acetobacteraceae bacterium]